MGATLETRARTIEIAAKAFLFLLFVGGVILPPLVIYFDRRQMFLSDKSHSNAPIIYCPKKDTARSVGNATSFRKTDTTIRLANLRKLFNDKAYVPEVIQAYIISNDGAHQSGYSAPGDRRREYISGFTGSAGTAVVTDKHAGLWTDSRYFLQAEYELDKDSWELVRDFEANSPTFGQWLNLKLPTGSVVGVDPTTVQYSAWTALEKDLISGGNRLVAVERNLVDAVWENRPEPPAGQVFVLDMKYSGKSWVDKVTEVRESMRAKKADYLLVTALDEVAWLLNLRGSDLQYTPAFFAYVIVGTDFIRLFLNRNKIPSSVLENLNIEGPAAVNPNMKIHLHQYDEFLPVLNDIVRESVGKNIWSTPESNYAIYDCVSTISILSASPVALLKTVKNKVEIQGMINGHIRDGAALAEFFAWMEIEVPKCKVTELSAAAELKKFRSSQENFVSLSFDTIAGSGPNGAIVHYRPTPETDRSVHPGDMFLIDSGSQYLDATTDVTRTTHYGVPTDFQKEAYTLVLKGNLALAMMKFPEKTPGSRLDSFARQWLWKVGLEYGHGTGHGVGMFMGVHEGPISVGPRYNPNDPGLQAGMVLSDEPGYYQAGEFGIRIETQMTVEEAQTKYGKDSKFFQLRYLTLAPLHRKLILTEMLSKEEKNYVDRYHADCLLFVGELLKKQGKTEAYNWLLRETSPL